MNKHSKRLSAQTWERVRTDYEVKRMSFNELQQRYEVHRSNISRKAQKQGWNRAQVQHALDGRLQAKEGLEAAINKLRLLAAYTVSKPQFATEKRRALEEEVDFREEATNLIEKSTVEALDACNTFLVHTQALENEFQPMEFIDLMTKALDCHSKALLCYSQAVFGKQGLPNI